MATTTHESLTIAGSAVTLNDTSGLTVANDTYTAAATTTLGDTQTERRPLVDFVLTITFAAAVSADFKRVALFSRYLNIDGVNDEPAPGVDSYFRGHHLGDFQLGDDATQYLYLPDVKAPLHGREVELYLRNESGQTINAWKLVAIPHGHIPAV